jgi:4'-phosphopantetheinyl transferase EntD
VTLDLAFDLELEHGRCVGMWLPDGEAAVEALAEAGLLPEERALAHSLTAARRRTWVGGRLAMRTALGRLGLEPPPILPDARGAPALPEGVVGSITHKEGLAAALVARDPRAAVRVGLDVELDVVRPLDISSRVLAEDELDELAGLDPEARAREVLLRFSAKEAVYKALDPFVQRYVGFKEVSVSTLADGGASVTLRLARGEGPFAIDVCWRRLGGIVLTTARVVALS